ncbi:lysis protein, partial [Rhizorhapis sp. SPR117]|nr:lysis protein [Rhizorhapis sp. SPR117]
MDIERTVSNDTDARQSSNYAATNDIKGMTAAEAGQSPLSQHENAQVVSALAGPVVLPEGVSLDEIQVSGRDLIVTLPDGTKMVIVDGAVFVPELVVGGIEIPPANIAALLIGAEPQPAAGSPQSSGGNFAAAEGAIGDPFDLGDLLPPTELAFSTPEQQELFPAAPEEDTIPDTGIEVDNSGVSVINAVDSVYEEALDGDAGQSAGTNSTSNAENTYGFINYNIPDAPGTVSVNGNVITADSIGLQITTPYGILTIVSIEPGRIGYTYELIHNSLNSDGDDFTVVVTDSDGDTASATLHVDIIDDVPVAFANTNSVDEGATVNG